MLNVSWLLNKYLPSEDEISYTQLCEETKTFSKSGIINSKADEGQAEARKGSEIS